MIDRDLANIDPTFRERVEELLRRLRADGYDPIVWEGRRSFARAEELQRRGTGVAKSVHCYGLAVDIVDRLRRWNAPAAFWAALGRHAQALGLEWGGSWTSRVDRPHVQALPATTDAWVRNATAAEIAERVRNHISTRAGQAPAVDVPNAKEGRPT